MTKIALTAAAILIATGSAFAGSDVYGNQGSRDANLTAVDNANTASIQKSQAPVQKPVSGADRDLFSK